MVSKPFSFSAFGFAGFWDRCSRRFGVLLFLFFCQLAGIFGSSFLVFGTSCFEGKTILPLFFSGVPAAHAGFLSCFTAFLLNLLIFLMLLFLLGVTAFGAFAVPVLTLLKGAAVGLGISSYLLADGYRGLGKAAVFYIPAAAASLLLCWLFSLRALVFSDHLRKVTFSSHPVELDLHNYWKDLVRFLCLAVVASLLCAAVAAFGALFLS